MQIIFFSICVILSCICCGMALYLAHTFMRPYKKPLKQWGFADLLEYAILGPDDTIILKNGGLMRVYTIQLHSIAYLDDHVLEKIHSDVLRAFKNLDSNYVINFDVIRTKQSNIKEPTSYHGPENGKKLFSKRFEQPLVTTYGCEFYLSITSIKANVSEYFFTKYFVDSSVSLSASEKDSYEDFIKKTDYFAATISSVARAHICTIANSTSSIHSHEAITFIKKCICGSTVDFYFDTKESLLDVLLASSDFKTGTCPKYGDKYISVVAIDGFPLESYFNALNDLASLPFEYRFSTRFISYSNIESNIKLEFYRRLWTQKKRGFLSQFINSRNYEVNDDAVEMIDSLKNAKKDLAQNVKTFGSYSANVVIFDTDISSLQKKAEICLSCIEKAGFTGRIESINATDAFLGSLPGHYLENLRRNIISTDVVADLMPLDNPYSGEFYSPNTKYGNKAPYLMMVLSANGGKAYLNLHSKDLGNTLVVGPPGTGKSVFLGSLITSYLRYDGMKIFTFDKGNSFYALTKALQGNHLTLDNKSSVKFCPLKHIETPSEISSAFEFICSLYENANYDLNEDEKDVLKVTINLLANFEGANRSLSDFHALLSTKKLKQSLEPYLRSHSPNCILDGLDNPNVDSALTVFECGQIFEKSNKFLYPTLNCIFNLINEEIVKCKCSVICIDEAWLMLANEAFCTQLLSWIKTVRKHNTTVIMATQSISDFNHSNLMDDLLDCVKTRIYLPNSDVTSPSLSDVYSRLGLNEKNLEEIYKGVPKQDLFMQKDGQFMPFRLCLGADELKLLSLTHKDKRVVDSKYEQYNSDFIWNL